MLKLSVDLHCLEMGSPKGSGNKNTSEVIKEGNKEGRKLTLNFFTGNKETKEYETLEHWRSINIQSCRK
jgi:hypothetical protein